MLRQAVAIEPNNTDVHRLLGLLLVRQHDLTRAQDQLRQASELAPDNVRYAHVYAIAPNLGRRPGAGDRIAGTNTHQQHPTDRNVLVALVSLAQEKSNLHQALLHAGELAALYSIDGQISRLFEKAGFAAFETDTVRHTFVLPSFDAY